MPLDFPGPRPHASPGRRCIFHRDQGHHPHRPRRGEPRVLRPDRRQRSATLYLLLRYAGWAALRRRPHRAGPARHWRPARQHGEGAARRSRHGARSLAPPPRLQARGRCHVGEGDALCIPHRAGPARTHQAGCRRRQEGRGRLHRRAGTLPRRHGGPPHRLRPRGPHRSRPRVEVAARARGTPMADDRRVSGSGRTASALWRSPSRRPRRRPRRRARASSPSWPSTVRRGRASRRPRPAGRWAWGTGTRRTSLHAPGGLTSEVPCRPCSGLSSSAP